MTKHGISGGERGTLNDAMEEGIFRMADGDDNNSDSSTNNNKNNNSDGSGPIGDGKLEVMKKDGGGGVASNIEVVESYGSSTEAAMTATTTTAATADALRNSGDGRGGISALPPVEGERAAAPAVPPAPAPASRKWYAYLTTKEFYIIVLLGQVLALCLTGTNTFSALLARDGVSIPAFQTLFTYALLNVGYTGYTLYRYGLKKWARMVLKDGWKYFILAFFDVEGNYFYVLAYRDTNILSAQLINFWAIVVVVALSFLLLRVRYHWSQAAGIAVCVGGMGMLLASDSLTGSNTGPARNVLRGDLYALLGATFYGLSNLTQEVLVSRRALYEVVGQLAWWATLINGTQAAIFERASLRRGGGGGLWSAPPGRTAGFLTGYTLALLLFYSLAPLLLRLASAAVFNLSLLTGNFWGVVVGVRVFSLRVHWLYPPAFALIVLGHGVYYVGRSTAAALAAGGDGGERATAAAADDAVKPWLGGAQQERGVDGVGTARRRWRKLQEKQQRQQQMQQLQQQQQQQQQQRYASAEQAV